MIYLLAAVLGLVVGFACYRLGYRAGTIDERLRCDDILQAMIKRMP
jgi:hypothetical protein